MDSINRKVDSKLKAKCIQFNYGELDVLVDALNDCYHSGQCEVECTYWERLIDWRSQSMDADAIRKELSEHGAWDDAELADDYQNRLRILWLASADYQEGL